eukprot:6967859-Alexandrium_andersonii.AAC.1
MATAPLALGRSQCCAPQETRVRSSARLRRYMVCARTSSVSGRSIAVSHSIDSGHPCGMLRCL